MNQYPNNPYEQRYEPTQRAPEDDANAPTLYARQTPAPQESPYPTPPYPPYVPQANGGAPEPYPHLVPPPPPMYNQGGFTPPPRRSRSTGKIVGLIALVAVLVIVGLIAIVVLPQHSTQAPPVNGTATAQARATAQAQQAAATAQAQATTTAVAASYPFSANVKLHDPLANSDGGYGWTTSQTCVFTGGVYHVVESQNNTYATCPASNTNFSNFTYQVSMTILKGDIGGITFRGDDNNNKYYTLAFGPDGSYALWVYSQASNPKTLQSGSATAFKTGLGQTNVLGVVARGDVISLYVNQQKLATVNDNSYSSGQIGVVGYDTTTPADVTFSNAEVWEL